MAKTRARLAQELFAFIVMTQFGVIFLFGAGPGPDTTARGPETEIGYLMPFVVIYGLSVTVDFISLLIRGGITTKAKKLAILRWLLILFSVEFLIIVVQGMIEGREARTTHIWRTRGELVHGLVTGMLMLLLYYLSVGMPWISRGAIMAWARRRKWGTCSSAAIMEWIFIPQVLAPVCAVIFEAIYAGGTAVHLWTEWSIHILIVLSFLLQVFLDGFAGIRLRGDSTAHRICPWLAYQLAEYVAVYPLADMSLFRKRHVDPLVIFWVPFFLLHLGGHDTLTAYSLEDNQVSLRRLLTLIGQVIGATHILRLYIARTRILASATILMFVVGLVKYVERVWALKCANIENLGTSLDIALIADAEGAYGRLDRGGDLDAEEEVLLGAHYLFSYCKSQLVDRQATVAAFTAATAIKQGSRFNGRMYIYELVRIELSLMYDFLYTKVPVIYTWHGCFIRVVSPLATVASFLLFQIGGHGAYSELDVFITYLLFILAFVQEMVPLLDVLCSTWTCALLHARNWDRIHAVLVRLRCQLKKARSKTRWLHSIGQHNLLDFCSRDKTLPSIRIASAVGLEDWWNKLHYSRTITIPSGVKEAVMEKIVQTMRQCRRAGLDIRNVRGRAVLTNSRIFNDIDRIFKDKSFDECILIWHIATEIYLCSCNRQNEEEPFVEAMELLSNYMGFLLMVRPELLPSGVSRSLYPDICSGLEKEWHELSTEKVEHGSRDSIGEDKDRTRQEEDTSKQSTGQVEDRRRQSTGEMEDETRISIKEEEGASKQSTGHVEVSINTSSGEMERENEIREVERENEIREVEDGNKIKEVKHENEIREAVDGNEIREVEHENQITEVKRENGIREVEDENEIREVKRENEIREVEDGSKIKEVEHENEIREVERENEIREVEDENEIRVVEHENEIREVEDGNIISTEEEGDVNHSMLTKRQKLAKHLLCKYNNSRYPTAYHKGSHLASKLLSNEWSIPNMPELIFAVWVEYLCYAAYHGTGVSHCRQLGSGGDFLTVIRLVIAHVELFELHRQDTEDHVEA